MRYFDFLYFFFYINCKELSKMHPFEKINICTNQAVTPPNVQKIGNFFVLRYFYQIGLREMFLDSLGSSFSLDPQNFTKLLEDNHL